MGRCRGMMDVSSETGETRRNVAPTRAREVARSSGTTTNLERVEKSVHARDARPDALGVRHGVRGRRERVARSERCDELRPAALSCHQPFRMTTARKFCSRRPVARRPRTTALTLRHLRHDITRTRRYGNNTTTSHPGEGLSRLLLLRRVVASHGADGEPLLRRTRSRLVVRLGALHSTLRV